jgi:hypothetical protein
VPAGRFARFERSGRAIEHRLGFGRGPERLGLRGQAGEQERQQCERECDYDFLPGICTGDATTAWPLPMMRLPAESAVAWKTQPAGNPA